MERVAAGRGRISRLPAGTSQRIQRARSRLFPAGEYRVPSVRRAESGADRVASDNVAVSVFSADDGCAGAAGPAERDDDLSERNRTGGPEVVAVPRLCAAGNWFAAPGYHRDVRW